MAQEDKKGGFFKKLAENGKVRRYIVLAGIGGMLLIFLSGYLGNCSGEKTQETSRETNSVQEYASALETKLSSLVDGITGQSGAQVMITMERTEETVYATENKESNEKSGEKETKEQEEAYILIKNSDGSQTALTLTQIQPIVKGVVVVCPRGGEAVVRQNVINAVTTALNISSARVCVLEKTQ